MDAVNSKAVVYKSSPSETWQKHFGGEAMALDHCSKPKTYHPQLDGAKQWPYVKLSGAWDVENQWQHVFVGLLILGYNKTFLRMAVTGTTTLAAAGSSKELYFAHSINVWNCLWLMETQKLQTFAHHFCASVFDKMILSLPVQYAIITRTIKRLQKASECILMV